MSKAVKITIIVVVALVLVLGIIGLIFLLMPKDRPSTSLNQRLDTPTNLHIDDQNWILSYSPVSNAESYRVFINSMNGSYTLSTTGSTVDVSAYISTFGVYDFSVQAIHSTPDYNSYVSGVVSATNTTTLLAPTNLSWNNGTLYWGQVQYAESYTLSINFSNQISGSSNNRTFTLAPNSFNFSSYIANNPELDAYNFFSISVKASSYSLETDSSNAYILDSDYSEESYFYRTMSINTPNLKYDFGSDIEQATAKNVSWDVDFAVEEYQLYIDGYRALTVTADELEGLQTYSVNLNDLTVNGTPIADTLGAHTVYLTALPKTNNGQLDIASQTSNEISYTVRHTLSAPDTAGMSISKQGSNLVITWNPVRDVNPYDPNSYYMATSYNLRLYANAYPDEEGSSFYLYTTVENLLVTSYTIALSDLETAGRAFCVSVQAVNNSYEYVLSSAYSELSSEYSAVTQLPAPSVTLVPADGVYSATWNTISDASAGYIVRVYDVVLKPDGTVEVGSVRLSQTVYETRITITDYMNSAGLKPGSYGITVMAASNSMYYTNSAESEMATFTYQVRLPTPTISSVVRTPVEGGGMNDYTYALTWNYIENAEVYYIRINNVLAFQVTQPSEVPANQLITETTQFTNYINSFNEPQQYRITVQAVITSGESVGYINSVQSTTYTFVNSFKHAAPTNLTVTQNEGSNVVLLSWDSVYSVTQSGGTYEVIINDRTVNNEEIDGSTVADISNYLVLGPNNTIMVRAANSGQLYLFSDYVETTYTYNYVLSGSSTLEFSYVPAGDGTEEGVQITIPAFNRYVTSYYLEFSTGHTLVISCEAGADGVAVVGFEYLPLYTDVSITVYPGRTGADTSQEYLDTSNCYWTQNYMNLLVVETPGLEYNADDYTIKITMSEQSVNYVSNIEWTFNGTTGVTYSDFISMSDFVNGEYILSLRDYSLINDGNNILVGGYRFEAYAVSAESNTLVSNTNACAFEIRKTLGTPTNFIQADDNSYLQWDYISDVDSYSVSINGSSIPNPVISEYTVSDGDGGYKTVLRLNTQGVFSAVGQYSFVITAHAVSGGYYDDGAPATHTWDFSNKLNKPVVSAVQRNNQWYLQILYNSLVDYYSIVNSDLGINAQANYVDGGYVYYNLESALASAVAGEYTFLVTANPRDTGVYQASDATEYKFTWNVRFNTPDVTAFQDFTNSCVEISWDDVSAEVLGDATTRTAGYVTISPNGYLLVITSASSTGSQPNEILRTTVYDTEFTLTDQNGLGNMTSGYYYISVTALGNGVMLDSFVGSIRFSYQEQLTAPTIAFNTGDSTYYSTILNEGDASILASNIDPRAIRFDLRVDLLDSTGGVASSQTFNNLNWASSTYLVQGGTHFTERGIYMIYVRSSQNGQFAASVWSDELVVYYGQNFVVVDNFGMSLTPESEGVPAQFTVNLNLAELPSLASAATYTIVINYTNGDTQGSFTKSGITGTFTFGLADFVGDYQEGSDEYTQAENEFNNFVTAWGTTYSTFNVTITAATTPVDCEPEISGGLTEFTFAPTSSYNYNFIIGQMNDPENIVASFDGQNVTISWTGDVHYENRNYIYSVEIIGADGASQVLGENGTFTAGSPASLDLTTTSESITFALPDSAVYAIHFNLQSHSGEGVSSTIVESVFINTQDLDAVNDFAVSYEKSTNTYTLTWTNTLQNGTAFNGSTYSLSLNGYTVDMSSVDISGETITVTISGSDEIISRILLGGRTVNYSITASPTYYNYNEENYIAYNEQTSVGSVTFPVLIADAPTNLTITGTVASWQPVTFATQYEIYISTTAGGEVFDSRSATTNATSYDISALIDGLDAGVYYVVVRVSEDASAGVYVSSTADKASVDYTRYTAAGGVSNLSVETTPINSTYRTVITWRYSAGAAFTVYITDSEGVRHDIITNQTAGTDERFTYNVGTGELGLYTLNYLDGSSNDISRSIIAGEGTISVVVCASGYYTDSEPVSAAYTNKFSLSAVTQDIIAVTPDVFVNEVSNHEVTSASDELALYEQNLSFNDKYLIITDDTVSYAQYFKVYLSTGTDENNQDIFYYIGDIPNVATALTYEAIANTVNKLSLTQQQNAVLAGAGLNKIKLVPWGDERYYFYVSGNVETPLSETGTVLESIFERNLYTRNASPALNETSLSVGYSDTSTRTNVNRVNIVFSNAENGTTYRVTPYYYDHYNSDTLTAANAVDMTMRDENFSDGVPLGLSMYDYISTFGPHEYYFTVQSLAVGEYELNSHTIQTPTTFEFKTQLMDFAPARGGDSSINSLVTEVTEQNAEEGDIYAQNGTLYWTLPTHPYSIKVRYTVTMSDLSQSFGDKIQTVRHEKEYSALLSIEVTRNETGEIEYTYSLDNSASDDGFILDEPNNRIIFDMKEYFEDRTRIDTSLRDGTYYLAGTYEYMLSAEALDKNGAVFDTRIFSPASYGSLGHFNPYTYRDVPFPEQPTNVQLSSEGLVTWDYNDTIYGVNELGYDTLDTMNFTIVVRTWSTSPDDYTDATRQVSGLTSCDISDMLIAGGSSRNAVFIYTNSPTANVEDESIRVLYTDSEWVEVPTNNLANSSDLPTITVDWDDHRQFDITLTNDVSSAVYEDITGSGDSIFMTVSLLKLADWHVGDPEPDPNADYDDVKENNAYIEVVWDQPSSATSNNYITYNRGMTEYDFNLINELNALVNAGVITGSDWLSGGDSLAGGYYYLRVSLTTTSSYYTSSTVVHEKMVREVWRSTTNDASITGEYLTTKTQDSAAQPEGNNARDWGNIDHKEARLTIYVNTITSTVDGVAQVMIPETITVEARLYNGLNYDNDRTQTLTYNIPAYSNLGLDGIYTDPENPDVTIERCYQGSTTTPDTTRAKITIDIHGLFDENPYAGVYHIFWILNGDEVGDSSPTGDPYMLNVEVCHYVVLPTPILDPRLSYTGSNYSNYVINWTLTPNPFTYEVNTQCSYNINLIAFEEINGQFADEILYDSLTPEEQEEFLSADMQEIYFNPENNPNIMTNLYLENYNGVSEVDGRTCFVQADNIVNWNLEPNKTYKVYIYLSTTRPNFDAGSVEEQDLNSQYYLNSDTSVGVEYTYITMSGKHQNSQQQAITDDSLYPLENKDIENGQYYTITSTQTDNYNNAFELWVYNTQDPRAATNTNWTELQEQDGTYLAHWIIGTRDNEYNSSQAVPLYILYDYEDRIIGSGEWDYSRQVGTLYGRNITLDKLTLSELLSNPNSVQGADLDKVYTPITYYCKIKTWVNNNVVNQNMPVSELEDGTQYYDDSLIYGERWVRENVPFVINDDGSVNEELVQEIVNTISGNAFTLEYLDFNSLIPAFYFTFNHYIRFAEPTLNSIEILNEDGSNDYVGASSVGATDGYIIADSNYGYYYRIWLDNVYTTDPLMIADKRINVQVGYTDYNLSDGGSSGTGNGGNSFTWNSNTATLDIHYDEDSKRAYVEIHHSGSTQALFEAMDSSLPNTLSFRFTVVQTGNPSATGGENEQNSFYTINNSTGLVNSTRTQITRNYIASETSTSSDCLTIRKQYTAPRAELMYDDMTADLVDMYDMQYITVDGQDYYTNLVSNATNAEYAGVAGNPYMYTSYDTLLRNGGQAFEYGMLATNTNTQYEIKLSYGDKSTTFTLNTRDVNATMGTNYTTGTTTNGSFASALSAALSSGKDTDTARYDYSTYQDIYLYEITCLYERIFELINEDTPISSGQYHGGRIDIDIRTVAPDGADSLNWVSSDWASEYTNGVYSFYFYPRLETVQATFNQNDCTFGSTYSDEIAQFYCAQGYYYYYQTNIPLQFNSISRDVDYYIYLTRTDSTTLSVDNSIVRSDCIVSPGNTNTSNTKNLASIFTTADNYYSSQSSMSDDFANNPWRLPENANDNWNINIVAAVDDSMEYVGRGYNSIDLHYTVNLKIKMDIQSLTIDMEPLVNTRAGTVVDLTASYLENGFNGESLWLDYVTTEDKSGQDYNLAATSARFMYYDRNGDAVYSGSDTETDNWFTINQTGGSPYYQLFYRFISDVFINDPRVYGGDGYTLYVKFGRDTDSYSDQFVHESDYSYVIYFNYYRQLPFDANRITFEQSGSSIVMTATFYTYNQIGGLNITLDQRNLSGGSRTTMTSASVSTSGSMYTMTARWTFSENNADCFSTDSYSASEANNCINNGYTNYIGYIQGGNNFFTITPIHDGNDTAHNLLPVGTYTNDQIFFEVPYHPSADITYKTSVIGDSEAVESDKWLWASSSPTDPTIVREVTYGEEYGVINSANVSFSHMSGASMEADWKYGFSLSGASISAEFSGQYSDMKWDSESKSTSDMTDLSPVDLSGKGAVNYLNLSVTVYCKPNFGSVFGRSSWSDSVNLSPGSGVQKLISMRKENDEKASVMDFVNVSVSGSMSPGDTNDYVANLGAKGDRYINVRALVSFSGPSGFEGTFSVEVSRIAVQFYIDGGKGDPPEFPLFGTGGATSGNSRTYRSITFNSGDLSQTSLVLGSGGGNSHTVSASGTYPESNKDRWWCGSDGISNQSVSIRFLEKSTQECSNCGGTGVCPNCDGKGYTVGGGWLDDDKHGCTSCGGSGMEGFWDHTLKNGTGNCSVCSGKGYI